MESDFPSRCAVKASPKGDASTIRQNHKTTWTFRTIAEWGTKLVSASHLLSPGRLRSKTRFKFAKPPRCDSL